MIRTNYHTHNSLCDGKGTIEEYVKAAVEKNFTALGFSSHAPVPFPTDWHLDEDGLITYLSEIRRLKPLWKDRIQLYAGLEVDYIPGTVTPADSRWKSIGLDYIAGSVHSTVGIGLNPAYDCVDGPLDVVLRLAATHHGGSWEAMCGAYYSRVRELVRLGGFQFLGHLDLVKKHNGEKMFFDENSPWYRTQVLGTLDVLSGSGIIMEVNSGAISRGVLREVYPSPWILAEARKRHIPVMINADAHRPEDIDCHFDESRHLIRDCGYREVWALLDGDWSAVPI